MNVRIYDYRDPAASGKQRRDPLLAHHAPPSPSLIVQGSRIPWLEMSDILDNMAADLCGQRFITFTPWSPGGPQRAIRFDEAFPSAAQTEGRDYITWDPGSRFIRRALELCDSLGGHNSGVWLLGAGQRSLNADDLSRAGLGADPVTAVAEALTGSLTLCLSLDEGDLSTLLLARVRASVGNPDASVGTVDASTGNVHACERGSRSNCYLLW